MVIDVHLHTTLQRQTPDGVCRRANFDLPEGATVQDVLQMLEIHQDPETLILVINHKVVDVMVKLSDGDRLDIVPAISGG